MNQSNDNGKAIKRTMVGTRYPQDRIALLDAVTARRGLEYRSEVVELALDRLLVDEGLLPAA